MKFIRHLSETAGQEVYLTTEVIIGSLTCIVTLTGLGFLKVDRIIAGRFFLIATFLGIALTALTAALVAVPAGEPPRGLETYYVGGVLLGSIAVIISNTLAFYSQLPSL
jgi:hypothetical protein